MGGLEANGLEEAPVTKGLVEIPAGWLSGLWPSLAEPKSPKEEPFCCGGNIGAGQLLAKAPGGGAVWGKPGPALFIPKPGPGARPLGWKGLVDGRTVWAAGPVKGLVKAPKARPALPPLAGAAASVGAGPPIPKTPPGIAPVATPGPRKLPISRLCG